MHKCDICHNEITSFQSWHANGSEVVHFACSVGRTPVQYAGQQWHGGDPIRVTLSEMDTPAQKAKTERKLEKRKTLSKPSKGDGGTTSGKPRPRRLHSSKHGERGYHMNLPINPKDFTEENDGM